MKSIRVPYLIINQGIISPEKSLEIPCTAYGFLNGFFKGAVIIDSNQNVFCAENAKKKGRPIFFWWINWAYKIFLNPQIEVELLLKPGYSRISLKELKKIVLSNRRHHFPAVDPEKYRKKILGATSAKKIIETIWEERHRKFK